MPISGLVLTLREPLVTGAEVMRRLDADGRFTCGAPHANRLPVVLETPDDQASRAAHDWLAALPGIAHIDIAFVGFDPPSP